MKFFWLTGLLLLIQQMASAQAKLEEVKRHITYLASDELEGRAPGTKGEKLAQDYIIAEFKKLNLKPAGTKGFLQTFDYIERPHAHSGEGKGIARTGSNLIGFLDNKAQKTIVIGAHYDHLGHEDGRGSSLDAAPDGKIHNGADDNASGVAGLIELARIYSTNGKKESVNFLFIAFSAEEAGLIGSKHFTKEPTQPLEKVLAMLNMDMIGRFRDSTRSLVLGGAATSPVWIPMAQALNRNRFELKFDSSGMGPSDHASFYLKDIPVLHFFSGTHADYHKPSDDVEKINFPGEVAIIGYMKDFIDSLSTLSSIKFTKTTGGQRKMSAFKVTMGIMADYAFAGPGVKVDGISPGKPAEKAGLKAGDLVLKIGEYPTDDIYKYMEALGKFEKGQKTLVEVERGKEHLRLELEF
jgi:hypothetical protein